MLHVAFDRFNQVWDEVMTPCQLDIDLRKCIANAIAFIDKAVVNTNRPDNDGSDNA